MNVKTEYDGIVFWKKKGGYYQAGRNIKPRELHRYKWFKEVGPVPYGYHIHHKDFNPSNNELSNLECLTFSEHKRKHMEYNGEEIRKHISEGTKKGMTLEVIEKSKKGIIELQKTGWRPNIKKTKCIETNIIYNSMLEAEEKTGVKRQNISKVCRGKRPKAGGYHWEYV